MEIPSLILSFSQRSIKHTPFSYSKLFKCLNSFSRDPLPAWPNHFTPTGKTHTCTHTPQYCYFFLNSSLVHQRENNQVVLKQTLLQIIIFK